MEFPLQLIQFHGDVPPLDHLWGDYLPTPYPHRSLQTSHNLIQHQEYVINEFSVIYLTKVLLEPTTIILQSFPHGQFSHLWRDYLTQPHNNHCL